MKKTVLISVVFALTSLCVWAGSPVSGLAERIEVGASKKFVFELSDQQSSEDFFELSQKGGKVVVRGNNWVSVASGLNWYLKYHVGVNLTWGNMKARLGKLPRVDSVERHSTKMLLRYYLNYCTFSYSMAFWGWDRWQQEIDWMALHGINMPLALNGAASVWRATLLELGYSKPEIDEFIAGPAHQAWWLMNNLEGWGGPNPQNWYDSQVELQQKIVARYREFGIEPVFVGYSGMIPRNAGTKLGLNVQDPGLWCGFNRPAFLQPTDPRFAEIAEVYYRNYEKLFGTAKYYAIDPFHEGGSVQGVDLKASGTAIYNAMKKASPGGVWVAQAWQDNPRMGMIGHLPAGDVVVLDLASEERPQWGDTRSPWYRKNGYEQHDWIYNMILNFGGNVGLYGKMQRVIDGYYLAMNHHNGRHMVGVGTTMEGIENNPVMYELLYELPWIDKSFTKESWLAQWPKRRYGNSTAELVEAWQILGSTAYNAPYDTPKEGTCESVLCARPALEIEHVSTWGNTDMYYDNEQLERALQLMMSVAEKFRGCNNFEYDLVDLARQVVANRAHILLPQIRTAFDRGDQDVFKTLSNKFLQLILLQDDLLASRTDFMVGPWIESAMRMGRTPAERDFYRWNARTLLTIWGDHRAANEGGLHDYAHREWSGLLRDFYYPRWKYFFDYINTNKALPIDFDYFDMEAAWTRQTNAYPITPTTDAIDMARKVVRQ
ncbi:MAG: alpha-N-acetylglucosaminidase [Mucinivorans sp.]